MILQFQDEEVSQKAKSLLKSWKKRVQAAESMAQDKPTVPNEETKLKPEQSVNGN